jgi:hypothetical protein
MPWSKISGRVVDGRGNGIANARLELTGAGMVANGRTYLRTSWGGGGGGQLAERPLGMTFRGNTDAQGRFEVQLMPGGYGLSAIPPPDLKAPVVEEAGRPLAWTRTYYPGVTSAEGASKIVVLPGGVSNVELKLLAVPTHAVRGVVLNPDGTPAPRVTVKQGEPFRPESAESKPDGTFEFPAVAEGEWPFLAEATRGPEKLRAVEWIEVQAHDVENLKVRLAAPLTVRGKVILEAPKDAPAPRLTPIILSLRGGLGRGEGELMGGALAAPDPKGDFVLEGAYPGVYRLGPLQPPPPPYYLDSVRIGGTDLLNGDVEISSDTAMTVVYKTDGGTVSGKAENCASGGVVLVPSDPARRGVGPPDPARATPAIITKFARCVLASITHWHSRETVRCRRSARRY